MRSPIFQILPCIMDETITEPGLFEAVAALYKRRKLTVRWSQTAATVIYVENSGPLTSLVQQHALSSRHPTEIVSRQTPNPVRDQARKS